MEPTKFEEYLEEKGLHEIIELRRQRATNDLNVREAYSRYSKSLVRVGGASPEDEDRVVGLRFEIVADANLGARRDGAPHSFHLLFDGRPLSGALVTAMRRNAPQSTMKASTDTLGAVTFQTNEPGVWLIAAVKMLPAPKGLAAEWESFWASLTYEMPAHAIDAGASILPLLLLVRQSPRYSSRVLPAVSLATAMLGATWVVLRVGSVTW